MSDILDKVRKLNWLLQESPTGAFSFDDLCKILGDLMEANIYIVDYNGVAVGESRKRPDKNNLLFDEEKGCYRLPEECTQEINKLESTKANLLSEDVLDLLSSNSPHKTSITPSSLSQEAAPDGARWS